jgi:hypothetical protein
MSDILKVNENTYLNLDAVSVVDYESEIIAPSGISESYILLWFAGNGNSKSLRGEDARIAKEALDLRAHRDTLARSRETMADLEISYPNEENR